MSKPTERMLITLAIFMGIFITVAVISYISGIDFAMMLAATSLAYSVSGTVLEAER